MLNLKVSFWIAQVQYWGQKMIHQNSWLQSFDQHVFLHWTYVGVEKFSLFAYFSIFLLDAHLDSRRWKGCWPQKSKNVRNWNSGQILNTQLNHLTVILCSTALHSWFFFFAIFCLMLIKQVTGWSQTSKPEKWELQVLSEDLKFRQIFETELWMMGQWHSGWLFSVADCYKNL